VELIDSIVVEANNYVGTLATCSYRILKLNAKVRNIENAVAAAKNTN
jgi:hypothetical protein